MAFSISHQGRETGARLLCTSGERKLAVCATAKRICPSIADRQGCLATRLSSGQSLIRASRNSQVGLILGMHSRRFLWGGSPPPQQPTTAAQGYDQPGHQESENLNDAAAPGFDHSEMQSASTQLMPIENTSTLDSGVQAVAVQAPSISTWDQFYHGSPDFWINVGFAQDVSYSPHRTKIII